MATVRPFRALRPAPGLAERVACPPYDVIDAREARALAAGDDLSFLYVSRPEVGLPSGTDEHDERAYAEGRRALERFCGRGALVPSAGARYWLYAQEWAGRRQAGLVACVAVDEYDRGVIRKHENTKPDKEDDRTRHVDALGAHDEPVFLTYRAEPAVKALLEPLFEHAPVDDFAAAAVRHTVWDVPDPVAAALERAFAERVPHLYVADGHHRSAAASRVHRLRAGRPGDHGAFLAVLVPDDEVRILPYNRLVRDARARPADELVREIAARFDVSDAPSPEPDGPHSFGFFAGGRWRRARVRPGDVDRADPVASLDCSLVQRLLLEPVFGIADPRRDPNLEFVGGIRGAGELERRVRAEGFALGLALYPTRVEELIAVSDAGLLMPPKSTWFEPKLRSGLFVHPFEPVGPLGLRRAAGRPSPRASCRPGGHVNRAARRPGGARKPRGTTPRGGRKPQGRGGRSSWAPPMPFAPRSQAATHVGRRRQVNQDSYFADDELGLYVVADGVGGNAGGEVASREAVEAISDVVRRGVAAAPGLRGRRRPDRELGARRLLAGALQAATYMVFGLAQQDRELAGMGTTVSALLVLSEYAVIAQVGDSRIYRWRRGHRAAQLTEDHTLVAWQLREGLISEFEAQHSPDRHVITRVVGCRDHVRADTGVVEAIAGDRFLLCSDGLHGYLRAGELEGLLGLSPRRAVGACIELANRRGGGDNITAVVVELPRAV